MTILEDVTGKKIRGFMKAVNFFFVLFHCVVKKMRANNAKVVT